VTAAASTPTPSDRYTAAHPCPVCGGHDRMPRGRGVRCDGYLLGDGAYCARDDTGKRHPSADLWWHRLRESEERRREPVATYLYQDADGTPALRVLRFAAKDFRQQTPDGAGGWRWGLHGTAPVLYRLPTVRQAIDAGDPVWIVEGEKDADRLHAEHQVATCNPMGAGKWRPQYVEALRGAEDVRVVADKDRPGYEHAAKVADSLRAAGIPVRVLECSRGKDVSDHLDAGGTLEELAEIDPRARLGMNGSEPPGEEKSQAGLEAIGFTGDRFLALLERPKPPPVLAAIPPAGHAALLIAPSMTGKSSLAAWIAMARAAGVAPWDGAPAEGPGRCLLYSIDEAPEQVARRMNSLATFHPGGPLAGYADRLLVVGPDREVKAVALDSLRFDDRGLLLLERWLREAQEAGDPFGLVVVDAYADVLPLGESENSNEEATRIGGALEGLAVRSGAAILVLHHAGKPRQAEGDAEPDLRFLGRGASALVAKARAVFSLELVPGLPHTRRVRTLTNLGPSPRPALFGVCSPEAPDQGLLYFRPSSAETARPATDLLQPGEEITTNELARRLAGPGLAEDAEPPGDLKRMAASLRNTWQEAGAVVVTKGQRGSKLLRLTDTGESK